jgi:hypothetical protein
MVEAGGILSGLLFAKEVAGARAALLTHEGSICDNRAGEQDDQDQPRG